MTTTRPAAAEAPAVPVAIWKGCLSGLVLAVVLWGGVALLIHFIF